MKTEIERKFLVADPSIVGRSTAAPIRMRQAYLSRGKTSVRVRVASDRATLTVKGPQKGITRPEYEYEIPNSDANEMIDTLAVTNVIEKDRYLIGEGDFTWEVDVFKGANQPLVLAEIELKAEDVAIDLPAWLGEEVSTDVKYLNAYLATHPYGAWRRRD